VPQTELVFKQPLLLAITRTAELGVYLRTHTHIHGRMSLLPAA
jgi:hypothetical protein